MNEITAYLLRTFILFLFTYFVARVLSKKAIAQMTSYELAGLFLLSNVAAEPLVTKSPVKAITGVILLALLIYTFTKMAHNKKLNKYLEHSPSIIVEKGCIKIEEMKKSDLTMNLFLGMLRQKGYDKIEDIEIAILEPQGQLSVFPKSTVRPVQTSEMGVNVTPKELTLPVLLEGSVVSENLKYLEADENWLKGELKKQNVTDYKEVLLGMVDSAKNLYVTRY